MYKRQQALRDASLADVIAMVEEAVAGGNVDTSEIASEDTPAPEEDEPGQGVGVAPRDASERMVFGTWATFTGKAAAGVTSALPKVSDEVASNIAERLTERAGIEVTTQQVHEAESLESLADLVREGLETEVEGNIRVLREADGPAVFMFHPAGGTTVVYQPLTRRLPEDVAVYGVERIEGSLEERAKVYVEDLSLIHISEPTRRS